MPSRKATFRNTAIWPVDLLALGPLLEYNLAPYHHPMARWPSGPRRMVQVHLNSTASQDAVSMSRKGRGFESHSCQHLFFYFNFFPLAPAPASWQLMRSMYLSSDPFLVFVAPYFSTVVADTRRQVPVFANTPACCTSVASTLALFLARHFPHRPTTRSEVK